MLARCSERERFDLLCYAPWSASLLGASKVERRGSGSETQMVLLTRRLAGRGLRVGIIAMGGPELPESADGVRIVRQRPRRHATGVLAKAALGLGSLRSIGGVRTRVL